MFTIYLISTHLAPLETLNENTSNFRLLIAVADLMANGGWMDVATNSRLGYDHDMTFKVEHLKWNPLAHFHCIGLSWLPCSTSMWWWWSVPLLQLLLASGHNHSCRQIQANVAHVAGDGEGSTLLYSWSKYDCLRDLASSAHNFLTDVYSTLD